MSLKDQVQLLSQPRIKSFAKLLNAYKNRNVCFPLYESTFISSAHLQHKRNLLGSFPIRFLKGQKCFLLVQC